MSDPAPIDEPVAGPVAEAAAGSEPQDQPGARVYRHLTPAMRALLPAYGADTEGDPTVPAGRAPGAWLYGIGLGLAALADVAQFYQVLELVMPTQNGLLITLAVVGFTAAVLYLSHYAGLLLRRTRARATADRGRRIIGLVPAALCVLLWLALGLTAFRVRYHVAPPPSGPVPLVIGDAAAPSVTQIDPYALEAGLMFLMLYLATGAIAAVGGYLGHHPLRGVYRAALREQTRTAERAAATAHQVAMAEAERDSHRELLRAAELIRAKERQARLALAEQLKQHARLRLAEHAQDPAVTDAILEPDRRPHTWTVPPASRNTSTNGNGRSHR